MLYWPDYTVKSALMAQKYGFSLFPSQAAASRYIVGERKTPKMVQVIGGERAGKSAWAGAEVATLLPWCRLVYLAGMEFENTYPEFKYIEDHLRGIDYLGEVSKPERGGWVLRMAESGAVVRCISFKQKGEDALITTGEAPDLVVLCEAGMMEMEFLETAYSRVAERRGAVIAVGTLKRSRPWYRSLYNKLKLGESERFIGRSFSFPSWENTEIYPGGRTDPAIEALEKALGPEKFAERIGAEPVPSSLLVFGKEFDWNMHVKPVQYEAGLPIWLACDPGYAGAYSLLVVQAASSSDVRVLDEYYMAYTTWDRAVQWLWDRPYIDVDPRGMIRGIGRAVMDVAGKQHHADKSQVEQWYETTGVNWRANPVPILEGITRLRDFLRSPFDWEVPRLTISPKCEGLLYELTEGEVYQKDSTGNPVREAPVDRHNHSRKALSYLLVDAFGPGDSERPLLAVQGGANPYRRARRGKVSMGFGEFTSDGGARFTFQPRGGRVKAPRRFTFE